MCSLTPFDEVFQLVASFVERHFGKTILEVQSRTSCCCSLQCIVWCFVYQIEARDLCHPVFIHSECLLAYQVVRPQRRSIDDCRTVTSSIPAKQVVTVGNGQSEDTCDLSTKSSHKHSNPIATKPTLIAMTVKIINKTVRPSMDLSCWPLCSRRNRSRMSTYGSTSWVPNVQWHP